VLHYLLLSLDVNDNSNAHWFIGVLHYLLLPLDVASVSFYFLTFYCGVLHLFTLSPFYLFTFT
jgi:hypothetical protein